MLLMLLAMWVRSLDVCLDVELVPVHGEDEADLALAVVSLGLPVLLQIGDVQVDQHLEDLLFLGHLPYLFEEHLEDIGEDRCQVLVGRLALEKEVNAVDLHRLGTGNDPI